MNNENIAVVREMWAQENSLANDRISWFTTIQGLLFASLALSADNPELKLTCLLAIAGIGVSVLTEISLIMGVKAKYKIRKWYEENSKDYTGPPLVGYIPKSFSVLGYFSPTNLLPILFVFLWSVILFR